MGGCSCSKTHLPGYVAAFETFKAAGAEVIVCVCPNDVFVTAACTCTQTSSDAGLSQWPCARAWLASPHADGLLCCLGGEAHGAGGKVTMLADPHLHLTKALGITLDAEGLLGTKR